MRSRMILTKSEILKYYCRFYIYIFYLDSNFYLFRIILINLIIIKFAAESYS